MGVRTLDSVELRHTLNSTLDPVHCKGASLGRAPLHPQWCCTWEGSTAVAALGRPGGVDGRAAPPTPRLENLLGVNPSRLKVEENNYFAEM